MTTANYKIVRQGQSWAVNHDGALEGNYAPKEAAFESAAVAASNAIKWPALGFVDTLLS